jgi:drug/metabolite transporter (DMT)-like permease
VALVLGAVSISVAVIAAKDAYSDGATPEDVIAARLLIAAPVAAFMLLLIHRRQRTVGGIGPVIVALAAGGALWLATRSELEGLERLPAGVLVLLIATVPVWVAASSWLGASRKPTRLERMSLAAIVIGVAVMAMPVGKSLGPLGLLLGLGAAISSAAFFLAAERNPSIPTPSKFLLGIVGAAAFLLATDPGALPALSESGISPPLIAAMGVATAGWALLVGIGVGATDAMTGALVVALEPVLVAALAFAILDEGLSMRQLAGGLVVLIALTAITFELGRTDEQPAG